MAAVRGSENRDSCLSQSRTTRETLVLWIGSLATALVSFWLATGKTWNPDYSLAEEEFNANFFRQQAISLLNGHFDVPGSGFAWTECHWVKGQCFGYFGVTPSALRLPVIAFGSNGPNLTPLLIAIAILLTMWAVLDLLLRLLEQLIPDPKERRIPAASAVLVTTLLLGVGSTLTFLTRPRIYHEAILWMIAFLLVAMNFTYRWLVHRRRRDLVVVFIAAVVSANARPSSAFSAVGLGVGVLVVLFLDRRRCRPNAVDGALAGGLTLLPFASSLGIVWLKFGTITEQWKYYTVSWMLRVRYFNDDTFQGLRFFPTNLLNYFRPDSIGFSASSPWVIEQVPERKPPIVISPIVEPGIVVEPVVSLTNSMTGPLLLTIGIFVAVLFGLVQMGRTDKRAFIILVVSAAFCSLPVLTFFSLSTRYLGDFYPLMAIGTIFAVAYGARWLQPRPRMRFTSTAILTVVALASFYVQLQLTV